MRKILFDFPFYMPKTFFLFVRLKWDGMVDGIGLDQDTDRMDEVYEQEGR